MWIQALFAFVITVVSPLLLKVLQLLGIGFVVYQGIDVLWSQIETEILSGLSSFGASQYGATAYAIMAKAGIIVAIKTLISTGGAILTLKGISAAAGRKSMILKA